MTSARESRAAGWAPTLSVIQLPRPTSGRRSPVDGIGRVRIAAPWADAVRGRKIEAAPAAARDESRARRLSGAARNVRMTIAARFSTKNERTGYGASVHQDLICNQEVAHEHGPHREEHFPARAEIPGLARDRDAGGIRRLVRGPARRRVHAGRPRRRSDHDARLRAPEHGIHDRAVRSGTTVVVTL